jgi:hypothetical protein
VRRAVTRSRLFLAVVGAVFLVVFAIPLFVVPFDWADAFGWDVQRTEVGSYFGRCLGAVAIALSGYALWGSRDPQRYRVLFELFAIAAALLAIVHLRGLVEDSQPAIEHVETLAYAAFAALALWCRPAERSSPLDSPGAPL